MKKRILIVDDDTSIRNGLKKLLKRANYDVALAADGFEGVDRFFSEPIDLLLLDLNMPGKDGWAACENITRRNPYVPTIIMTGLPDQFPIASAAGAGALLEKPLNLEELLRTIEDLLQSLASPTKLASRLAVCCIDKVCIERKEFGNAQRSLATQLHSKTEG